jgi:beta-glucosidase
MKRLTVITGMFLLVFSPLFCRDKSVLPYKNPDLSIDKRVEDLLSRMTLDEKFWQLYMMPGDLNLGKEKFKNGIFGLQVHTYSHNNSEMQQILNYGPGLTAKATAEHINEIQRFFVEETRLGIPIIPFDEALHGLIRRGATTFPQAIGLAASFDTAMVSQVAEAIAHESKSRGIRQILSPVVNLATDPRWGRVEETYGEDPFLSARMGVAFVSSFEQMGVITSPKHFVANHGDGGRDSYPVHYSERLMEETYFVPFKACFLEGKSQSVMTAYNTFDGSPCSANSALMKDKLQKEWGFDGFSISDANAVDIMYYLHHTVADLEEAGAAALNNGLHVIFQVKYETHEPYLEACRKGYVSQENLDDAVRRVLRAKFRLGLFENPYVDPEEAAKWNASPAHRELNIKAAQESIVLLKNERNTLPVSKNLKRIAVLGEDARQARPGGYSGPGIERISILKGIENKVGKQTEIVYAEGCKRLAPDYITVPVTYLSSGSEKGLKGEYFDNIKWEGEPKMTRYDRNMLMKWTLFSPDPDLFAFDWYSVRWTGQLKSPVSGTYEIGIEGNDGYTLYIDNKKVIERPLKTTYTQSLVPFTFEKDKLYDIRIEFYENYRNGRVRFIWNVGVENEDKKIQQAVDIAGSSDAAIIVVGIEEAEFRDRAFLNLPGRQEELINKVSSTGVPTVVVLVGGSAVTMDSWIKNVPAIVDVWYPGDVGGIAVADVLFGDYNPGGKLPITFPRDEGQLTLNYNHKPTGRGDEYLDLSGEALFPFGHGLSYTTFEYSDFKLMPQSISATENINVSCKIKNTGKTAGEEVVQLYLHDILSDVSRPINELKGFRRIPLNVGEEKVVEFVLTPDDLSHLDINMKKIVEPGDFRVMIGSSSKDIRLKGLFNVKQRHL